MRYCVESQLVNWSVNHNVTVNRLTIGLEPIREMAFVTPRRFRDGVAGDSSPPRRDG
ncbi:MAG: hypothetical protein NZT92_11775 [Abditibacteriales bacterium]|nr:hypothetical protein [Abditibacteriales bacterium]MDW8365510.1 hypothetical protein [Abditibacteriales bacterium]